MPSKLTGMLSSGRPIISTALPGTQIAGVVEETGLVVEPGCLQAVVAAIIRLGEDPELRKTLGAAARTTPPRLFEQDKVLAGLEQELLAVLTPEPEADPERPLANQPRIPEKTGAIKQDTRLLDRLASLLRAEMPADLDTLDQTSAPSTNCSTSAQSMASNRSSTRNSNANPRTGPALEALKQATQAKDPSPSRRRTG
jgi:hypothetical protein